VDRVNRSKNTKFLVLDDGFVQVDGVLYSDADVTRIARITALKAGKTKFRDDRDLLAYFLREKHASPFGFPTINLLIRCPFPIREQWFRHRTGHRAEILVESTDPIPSQFSEQQQFSGRYAPYNDGYNIPTDEYLLKPSSTNNQTSSEEKVEDTEGARNLIISLVQSADATYRSLIGKYGLARERARWVVPMAAYTEFYFQQNLWNVLDWLTKRRSAHAQKEIVAYAKVIEQIVKEYFPLTYEAWIEVVEGVTLTRTELHELRAILESNAIAITPKLEKRLYGTG
jgi:thymidylate synthase (FAD)